MYLANLFSHSLGKLIHPKIHEWLKEYNGWVVGGSLASLIMHAGDRGTNLRKNVNDIDVYFETAEKEKIFRERCQGVVGRHPDDTIDHCYQTQCATTLYFKESQYPPMQILHLKNIYKIDKEHWDVLNALNKFDFTAIQMGHLVGSDQVCAPSWEKALSDIAARRLILSNDIDYPISTLVRVQKYLKKGFNIQPSQLVKLAIKINQCDISTVDALKAQLHGIDMALLSPVISALEVKFGKDPASMADDIRLHFLNELDNYLDARI